MKSKEKLKKNIFQIFSKLYDNYSIPPSLGDQYDLIMINTVHTSHI